MEDLINERKVEDGVISMAGDQEGHSFCLN